jgi:uncharacterized protein YkwD
MVATALVLSALVALMALSAGFTAEPAAGSARSLIAPARSCPDQSVFQRPARAKLAMTCMTNYARRAAGLPRYRSRLALNRSATRKAADILRCNSFSHTACGRTFSFWIERSYVSRQCWWAGENIAWGTGSLGGVRQIFKAWMRSPGHRSAILSKDYSDMGIGLRTGSLRSWRGAAVWVQHFGKLC